MCILAVATAGAQFSRDTLKAMFYANSDGAGWAYAKDGKIYYAKGYTSANKFIKAILKLPVDVARMVHCRIGTHGGLTRELTHPFPVSTDYTRMEMLSGVLSHGYILAHNGILSNFTPDKSHSDTEELVRCLANLNCDIMRDNMRDLINALIDGSRVAILNTDGKINRYGTGWTQDGGIWYSNTYFKSLCSANNYKYYRDYDYDYDYDYGSYYASAHNTIPAKESLLPLEKGEIVRNTESKRAFINATEGAYLLHPETGKLYGQYKGAIFDTKYEICSCINCVNCTYKCPITEDA